VNPPLVRLALALALAALAAAARPARADDPPPTPPPSEPAAPEAPAEPDEDAPDKTRGYVGYTPVIISTLLAEDRKALGVTREHGFVVRAVIPKSPAEKAGLKAGDILLRVNGEAMPDTKGIDPKNEEQLKKFWKETWEVRVKKVKPGDVVTIDVERAGKPVTVKATAIPWEEHHALVEKAKEEAMAVQVPDPTEAGAPAAQTVDFETVPDGDVKPEGFLKVEGVWEVYADKSTPGNHVLRQYSSGAPFAICLVTGKGRALADGTVKVRLRCLDGMDGVGGGVVIRAKDRKNYLVLRADGVAKNLRVVAFRDQKPTVLASVDIDSPKLRTWLTFEVTFRGAQVKAVLDGKVAVEATDDAPGTGWCGLATPEDAETEFEDLSLAPAAAAGK
jgi:hypothetical protein